MTSTLDRDPAHAGRSTPRDVISGEAGRRSRGGLVGLVARTPVVWVVTLVAVALRLPLLGRTATPDEAGFLLVGGQWHPGGTSLYGNYWVDRPPLLITVFRLAAEAGGLVPLRLIGCLATALTILGVAHAARSLGGSRVAAWAALTAAALLVTPLTGAMAVNGELLASPSWPGASQRWWQRSVTESTRPCSRPSLVARSCARRW